MWDTTFPLLAVFETGSYMHTKLARSQNNVSARSIDMLPHQTLATFLKM